MDAGGVARAEVVEPYVAAAPAVLIVEVLVRISAAVNSGNHIAAVPAVDRDAIRLRCRGWPNLRTIVDVIAVARAASAADRTGARLTSHIHARNGIVLRLEKIDYVAARAQQPDTIGAI